MPGRGGTARSGVRHWDPLSPRLGESRADSACRSEPCKPRTHPGVSPSLAVRVQKLADPSLSPRVPPFDARLASPPNVRQLT